MAETVLAIVGIYLALGALFAIAFVIRGCSAIDPTAKGAGVGFRMLIFPASAALWPLLLTKWLKVGSS